MPILTKSQQIFLSIALIIVLGFAVYGNSLNNGFIWDDEGMVEDNQYIKNWSHLPQTFTKGIGKIEDKSTFYRPFQIITYMIDYSLWELNPIGYHLSNLLLHISVALSIYWLIHIIFKNNFLSLITGAFFVVHPIHTEAVTYISGRADLLALLFMLLCFIFYIKSPPSKRVDVYILMLLSYILALFSKESSLILPILILFYHYSFKSKLKVKEFLSIVSIVFIYILIRTTVLNAMLMEVAHTTTLLERLPGFFVAMTNYTRLLFFPFDLHMEYGNALFSWGSPKAILGIIILLTLFICTFRNRNKNNLIFFAISWFIVALIPSSNLYPINAYMAEHWLYLPSVGFFLMIAKGIQLLYQSKNSKVVTAIFGMSLLFFYSYLTVRQNAYWEESINFYESTLKHAPNSARVHYNLGIVYQNMNNDVEAIAAYKKAIEIKPDFALAHHNLGTAYYAINQNEEAVAAYKKSIVINPDYASAYYNLGNLYTDINEIEKAIVFYKKAIEIKADYADAYHNLGNIYKDINEIEKAIVSFKKAIEINHNHVSAYNNLAMAYFQENQHQLAIEYYNKTKELGLTNLFLLEALKPYRKDKEE